MKTTVTFIFIAAITTLTSARPTFDKIAEALLEVVDPNPYPRYPSGSANYQQGYHQHHHDHHYYGNGAQPDGYYQQPHGGYYPAQVSYVQGPGPYAPGHYPQQHYPQGHYAHGNYGGNGYVHPEPALSVGITAGYEPSGYARHHSYKQHGY
ncbi:pupal cuticle protein Edg-91-like [Anastrepha ludens]|uniref:pupal cuticle protein Edg-91-like n=1 Tax=Anastrepha ludens TaxID=28586 RepID=UPI0023B0881A|nr:pupal cuticle protein Edg-91-like [Anastrepha ludens]